MNIFIDLYNALDGLKLDQLSEGDMRFLFLLFLNVNNEFNPLKLDLNACQVKHPALSQFKKIFSSLDEESFKEQAVIFKLFLLNQNTSLSRNISNILIAGQDLVQKSILKKLDIVTMRTWLSSSKMDDSLSFTTGRNERIANALASDILISVSRIDGNASVNNNHLNVLHAMDLAAQDTEYTPTFGYISTLEKTVVNVDYNELIKVDLLNASENSMKFTNKLNSAQMVTQQRVPDYSMLYIDHALLSDPAAREAISNYLKSGQAKPGKTFIMIGITEAPQNQIGSQLSLEGNSAADDLSIVPITNTLARHSQEESVVALQSQQDYRNFIAFAEQNNAQVVIANLASDKESAYAPYNALLSGLVKTAVPESVISKKPKQLPLNNNNNNNHLIENAPHVQSSNKRHRFIGNVGPSLPASASNKISPEEIDGIKNELAKRAGQDVSLNFVGEVKNLGNKIEISFQYANENVRGDKQAFQDSPLSKTQLERHFNNQYKVSLRESKQPGIFTGGKKVYLVFEKNTDLSLQVQDNNNKTFR